LRRTCRVQPSGHARGGQATPPGASQAVKRVRQSAHRPREASSAPGPFRLRRGASASRRRCTTNAATAGSPPRAERRGPSWSSARGRNYGPPRRESGRTGAFPINRATRVGRPSRWQTAKWLAPAHRPRTDTRTPSRPGALAAAPVAPVAPSAATTRAGCPTTRRMRSHARGRESSGRLIARSRRCREPVRRHFVATCAGKVIA
jgi:hypothetical protein